jgi:hypothetical protein
MCPDKLKPNREPVSLKIIFKLIVMKLLLILVASVSVLIAQAQQRKWTKKFSVGYNFSPDYSYRTLKISNGAVLPDFLIKLRNDIEIAKPGFTTGLNFRVDFSNRVAFETGIQYSNKGYKTKNQGLVYSPSYATAPSAARSTYAYQYIGIPLKARWTFGGNRIRLGASAAIMANFLLNEKATIHFKLPDGSTKKSSQSSTSEFKKIDISPMISFGIDWKLTVKTHLFGEPTFRYGLIKTVDAPVAEHLWSAGLNFGIYHQLK